MKNSIFRGQSPLLSVGICLIIIALIGVSRVSRYFPNALAGNEAVGLTHYWNFDEGSGTTAADSIGGASGSLINGPAWAAGKIGQALSFDGVDDLVRITGDQIGTGDKTIAAWVYLRGYGEGGFGDIVENGNAAALQLVGWDKKLWYTGDNYGTSAFSSSNSIPLNTWTHVAVTRSSSGQVNFYINGALNGTANQPSGTPIAGSHFTIGNRDDGVYTFDGLIDEVRVYNRVLPLADIQDVYNYTGAAPAPLPTFPLTVTKDGTGTGTVTGTGISCGADCSESIQQGTSVTLTAAPDANNTFDGWQAAGCSTGTTCTITVNATTTVNATFNPIVIAPDTTPPVISGINSSNVTASAATISWTTNEPSDTQIEYGLDAAYGSLTALAPALITSHSQNIIGLSTSTAYHYRAISKDAAGNIGTSSDQTFTTITPDLLPPSVPTNLSATNVTSSQVTLTWSTSLDQGGGTVSGYRIYRNGGPAPVGTAIGVSFTDSGLSADTVYTYTISAFDNASPANESAQTSPALSVHTLVTPPQPSVTVTDYLDMGSNSTVGAVVTPALATGENHGNSALWTLASTLQPTQLFTAALTGRPARGPILLASTTYNDTGSVNGYRYHETAEHQYIDYEFKSPHPSKVSLGMFFKFSGAWNTAVGKYYDAFAVTSDDGNFITFNVIGGSPMTYQIETQSCTSGKPLPMTPQLDKWYWISMLWNTTTLQGTLNIYDPSNAWQLVGSASCGISNSALWRISVGDYTAHSNPGIDADMYMDDLMVDSTGAAWPLLPAVTVNDTQAPSIPASLSGNAVSPSQINLSWTASTDNVAVSGYKIFRNGNQVGTSATASFSDSGLTASTVYTYTISAFDGASNNSAQSSPVTVTTPAPDTQAPTVPANLLLTSVTNTSANLSWTASTDNVSVIGYKVYRCTGSACTPSAQIATSTGTAYANSGLTAGTAYGYAVSAYDGAGNVSAMSSAVSTTTLSSSIGNGLVAYWSLNEGSGTIAGDSSGNNNLGTLTGSPLPAWITGQIGTNALQFNGSTNSVSVPNKANLSGMPAVTVSAWVKFSSLPSATANIAYIVEKTHTGNPSYSYYLSVKTNNKVEFSVKNLNWTAGTSGSTSVLSANQWYHIVGVYDGANLRIYINGVANGSTGHVSGAVVTTNSTLNINFNSKLNGSLDDVRVYNRALSASEVTSLYNFR